MCDTQKDSWLLHARTACTLNQLLLIWQLAGVDFSAWLHGCCTAVNTETHSDQKELPKPLLVYKMWHTFQCRMMLLK